MKQLKKLINEIARQELIKLLLEDEMDLARQAETSSGQAPEIEQGEDDIDVSGGGLEDLADEVDTNTATDTTNKENDTEDDQTMNDTESESGFGGSSSFGGSFSGGSSGGGFDFGFDSNSDTEPKEKDEKDINNNGIPDTLEDPNLDPVQAVVGIAKDLRTKTGDAQQILNTVKAAIQERFANYDDAAYVIQYLWDTNEPVLQVVARKLILFIKGQ